MINNINKILDEYKPHNSIWREDDDFIHFAKEAIQSLSDSDKIIFVLYCEYGSLRKVAKDLGVSHTIIYKEITRIRGLIYDYIKINSTSDNNMLLN